jgi:hypothetical protein
MSALHPIATAKADIEPPLTACPGWLSRAVNGGSSRHLVGVWGPAAPTIAARRLATKTPPTTNASPANSAGLTGSPRNKLASRIATIPAGFYERTGSVLAFTVPPPELMAPLCQTECAALSTSCKLFLGNNRSGRQLWMKKGRRLAGVYSKPLSSFSAKRRQS